MLKRVSLFTSKKEFSLFVLFCAMVAFYSLYIEYKNYKEFIKFDNAFVEATVLLQYTKNKNGKTYEVLKLKSSDGLTFYTTLKKSRGDLRGKKLQLEIFINIIPFYEYLTQFYANSKIVQISYEKSSKQKLNDFITDAHESKTIANIYQALYTAEPVTKETQLAFSNLGVSHIVAISGFHLGVLSALLYFFLKPIYYFFQNRFFPYTNSKAAIFVMVSVILFAYTFFLDSPPSLVRSLGMFIVAFFLYDRGVEIFSMQTLLVTTMLLLAFFPRLSFSLGFWLSAGGVFYIFLFLIHFKNWSTFWQLVGISVLVYLFMLPVSLYIFENFSLYHPFSIILSILFTPFYPISILLHLVGHGYYFDTFLEWLMALGEDGSKITLNPYVLSLHVALSVASIWSRVAMLGLILFSSGIFLHVYITM